MPQKQNFIKKFAKSIKMTKFLSVIALCLAFVLLVKVGDGVKEAAYSIIHRPNLQTNKIAIGMATDENYVYPTIVTATSLLENASLDTKYEIIIMHPSDLLSVSKEILLSLNDEFPKHEIKLHDVKDAFDGFDDQYRATPLWYKLKLASILPNYSKCIWLDSDVLVFKNLSELNDIDMSNYYVAGVPSGADFDPAYDNFEEKWGIPNDLHICTGVDLFNLSKIRQDKIETKMMEMGKNSGKLFPYKDEDAINIVCYPKIKLLHPKYGILNLIMPGGFLEQRKIIFGEKEYQEAISDPVIVHLVDKPWKNNKVILGKTWWEYAEKTRFYEEICKKYRKQMT